MTEDQTAIKTAIKELRSLYQKDSTDSSVLFLINQSGIYFVEDGSPLNITDQLKESTVETLKGLIQHEHVFVKVHRTYINLLTVLNF